jgi:hypothetical protein
MRSSSACRARLAERHELGEVLGLAGERTVAGEGGDARRVDAGPRPTEDRVHQDAPPAGSTGIVA